MYETDRTETKTKSSSRGYSYGVALFVFALIDVAAIAAAVWQYNGTNETQKTEQEKSALVSHFQTASAADRLQSLRLKMVDFQCQNGATGLSYTFGGLEEEDVTDEGLKARGCTITRSVGGESVVLAPASAPAP